MRASKANFHQQSWSQEEVEELRRQIAMENQFKDPKLMKKEKPEMPELPSEFECCFCSSDDFKECIDAEGLMPLNTSDLHKTICMEMRMAKAMNILSLCHGGTKSSSFVTPPENVGPNKFTFPSIDAAVRTIPTARERNSSINSKHSQSTAAVVASSSSQNRDTTNGHLTLNQNYNLYNSNNADLASVDSSDTFMSCQTHPFLSQGDLTMADDDENNLDMLDADSLYLNAMNMNSSGTLTRGSSLYSGAVNIDDNLSSQGQVKKSTSGDTALRSLGVASPTNDSFTGSRVSLNETPVPKHRKTRFQQQQQQQQTSVESNSNLKPKTRFDEVKNSIESLEVNVMTNSNKKNRRASFLPSKIITTATKQLINQHLFGIQTKDGSNETHKRSKSILKNKSDVRLASDPESERLLSDTGSGVSDISVIPAEGNFDFSLNKIVHKSISPQMSQQRHQRLVHQRSTPISIGRTKFQTPRQPEETMLRQAKPMLQRGMGFGGTTISNDGGVISYRFEPGTRESSIDSDNAYSTYPQTTKDNTKDESSSSTLKASNDQIASSSILDKQNSSNYGGGTAT